MKTITLYRDDFKAPQDGVEPGWTFFDDTLVKLGVSAENTQEYTEVDLDISDYTLIGY